jgi:hypothetical protein
MIAGVDPVRNGHVRYVHGRRMCTERVQFWCRCLPKGTPVTDSSSSLPDPLWPTPKDAILQPPTFPPPPDPVLSPPWLPPPWDQPRPVPPTPQQPPAQPSAPPPATPKRSTRAAQPAAPVRQTPVWQPQARPTPAQQRPQRVVSSPEQRSRRTLIGALIAVVLLVCCAPALVSAVRNVVSSIRAGSATATASQPPALAKPPTLSYPTPSAIVEQAQPSAFLLPIGTGVRVTDGANQWTATVVDAVWLATACDGAFADPGPVVVVGVRFDVGAGQLTTTPDTDFAYRDSAGQTHFPSRVSGCADPVPALQATAGEFRTAMMAFDDPTGGGGELVYSPSLAAAGSWRIPARPA